MQESDSQRLRAINTELIELYVRLHSEQLSKPQEQVVRSQIVDLEAERTTLPSKILYDNKVQQYVTILQSAASSLQLQRQSLYEFDGIPTSKLSPDQIRQHNILLNKIKSIEKKIETYRQKLSELGVLPFEIDDIILQGYRERHQRGLQKVLRSFEATLDEYLLDYYIQYDELPDDLFAMLTTWEHAEKRSHLTSIELQILQKRDECLQKGIPDADIHNVIKAKMTLSDAQQQDDLRQLQATLQMALSDLDVRADGRSVVENWITQYQQDKQLAPRQVEVVRLVIKLRMYGVSEKVINRLLMPDSKQDNGFFLSLKNRFRRGR